MYVPDGNDGKSVRVPEATPGMVVDVVMSKRRNNKRARGSGRARRLRTMKRVQKALSDGGGGAGSGGAVPRMGEGLWVLREGTADLALDQRIMEEEVHTYRVPDKEEGDAAEDEDEVDEESAAVEEDEIGTTLRVWPRLRSQALGMGAGYDEEEDAYFIPHTLKDPAKRKALWDAFGIVEEAEQGGESVNDGSRLGDVIEVPMVLIKTDTAASLETVLGMVEEIDVISTDRLDGIAEAGEDVVSQQDLTPDDGTSTTTIPALSIVHAGVGPVTSTDIKIALVQKSPIYCFNVGLSGGRKIKDEARRVDIFRYDIIDDLFANMLADADIITTIEVEEQEYS